MGWGLFLPPVVGGAVADKSQPTKSEAFMVGGANGSRVADFARDSDLILASATLVSHYLHPRGGAASLVGWGLSGGW